MKKPMRVPELKQIRAKSIFTEKPFSKQSRWGCIMNNVFVEYFENKDDLKPAKPNDAIDKKLDEKQVKGLISDQKDLKVKQGGKRY